MHPYFGSLPAGNADQEALSLMLEAQPIGFLRWTLMEGSRAYAWLCWAAQQDCEPKPLLVPERLLEELDAGI